MILSVSLCLPAPAGAPAFGHFHATATSAHLCPVVPLLSGEPWLGRGRDLRIRWGGQCDTFGEVLVRVASVAAGARCTRSDFERCLLQLNWAGAVALVQDALAIVATIAGEAELPSAAQATAE